MNSSMTPPVHQSFSTIPGTFPIRVPAAIWAFVWALLSLRLIFQQEPVDGLIWGIPGLVAGLGILRGRAWSAYGFALFQAVESLFRLWEGRISAWSAKSIFAAVALYGLCSLFFFWTGRSLSKSGAKQGRRGVWIALNSIYFVLLIFVRPVHIWDDSMENLGGTLLRGDAVLCVVFPRPQIARGDIVTYWSHADHMLTRRVVGLPGDRIRIVSKTLYRNGSAVSEPYAKASFGEANGRVDFPKDFLPMAETPDTPSTTKDMLLHHVINGELRVPEGRYFLLSDNRDEYAGSLTQGFASAADIVGKPFFIYDSEAVGVNGVEDFGMPVVRWRRLFMTLE